MLEVQNNRWKTTTTYLQITPSRMRETNKKHQEMRKPPRKRTLENLKSGPEDNIKTYLRKYV
jgi:hypothetical protein